MSRITFGTKAHNLSHLLGKLKSASIPDFISFDIETWIRETEAILDSVHERFGGQLLAIRSSCVCEDTHDQSNAGAFLSLLGISSSNRHEIQTAIEQVAASFNDKNPHNQILVQKQVEQVAMSGVIVTRDIDSLAPYYLINFDDCTGTTDSVTAGKSSGSASFTILRNAEVPPIYSRFQKVLTLAKELEEIFQNDALDIEFAMDKYGQLFLLQVRPIAVKDSGTLESSEAFEKNLYKIFRKIKKLNGPHPGIHGNKAMYSIMTDWNPAEMIGVKPRPLALSLYKELITDAIWAYQRSNYGYRNLRSFPLLISFLGFPYIDVRTSLNSFVPRDIDEDLSAKLVDFYSNQLCSSPSQHDKIEFNIVYSCYYFNLPEKLTRLLNSGFSKSEIECLTQALKNLTNKIISPQHAIYKDDLEKIEKLVARCQGVLASDLFITDKIYWLIEECKRYGTLPFAGLARAGFIAMQLLRSLVETGIFSAAEQDSLMQSLNTVSRQLTKDSAALRQGTLSQAEFLKRYGHLRPGTYDILSPRYDENFELYFDGSFETQLDDSLPFALSDSTRKKLSDALMDHGLSISAQDFLAFLRQGIEGREQLKFSFTKIVSELLRLITELGSAYGFSKDDMSYLDIRVLMDLYSNLIPADMPEILARSIDSNREDFRRTQNIRLPALITSEDDIYAFLETEITPNFFSAQRVTKAIILEEDLPQCNLDGKILLIRSADPGYDWVFSRNIGGLITMYGGVNSHMAIRCAELGLPAIIGCGERNFREWSKARLLDIDCIAKTVRCVL